MKHEAQTGKIAPIDHDSIRQIAKRFILTEYLPDEQPDHLTDATALISSGIIDSIGLVRLITHLEEVFQIEIETVDVTIDNFDNLASIVSTIQRKRS
jgi:acyl carrier protein